MCPGAVLAGDGWCQHDWAMGRVRTPLLIANTTNIFQHKINRHAGQMNTADQNIVAPCDLSPVAEVSVHWACVYIAVYIQVLLIIINNCVRHIIV